LSRAQALAAQNKDAAMRQRFAKVAQELEANEAKIAEEMLAAQGRPVDLGGYYLPDPVLAQKAMRPSATFNAIIDAM
jgi:isocitrate dehydrogenase